MYVAALPVENLSWNLQQITNVVFDETQYILSYSSPHNAIVIFTTAARNVHLLPVYAHEDAYATRQLHRQWRSGPCRRAKRPANVNAVQLRLIAKNRDAIYFT